MIASSPCNPIKGTGKCCSGGRSVLRWPVAASTAARSWRHNLAMVNPRAATTSKMAKATQRRLSVSLAR